MMARILVKEERGEEFVLDRSGQLIEFGLEFRMEVRGPSHAHIMPLKHYASKGIGVPGTVTLRVSFVPTLVSGYPKCECPTEGGIQLFEVF
jgi:hypothetical protein